MKIREQAFREAIEFLREGVAECDLICDGEWEPDEVEKVRDYIEDTVIPILQRRLESPLRLLKREPCKHSQAAMMYTSHGGYTEWCWECGSVRASESNANFGHKEDEWILPGSTPIQKEVL